MTDEIENEVFELVCRYTNTLTDARNVIRVLRDHFAAKTPAMEWKSLDDEKPPIDQKVLIKYENDDGVFIASFGNVLGAFPKGHWMKLPGPPRPTPTPGERILDLIDGREPEDVVKLLNEFVGPLIEALREVKVGYGITGHPATEIRQNAVAALANFEAKLGGGK